MIYKRNNNTNNKKLCNRAFEGAKMRNQADETLITTENLPRIIQNIDFV